MTVKTLLQNIYISNKCCTFEHWNHENTPQKILSSTMFSTLTIRHVSWAANQHHTMNSEGSCDTED